MDDLIYGLLVVAWIVYGIYSAAKKNKAKGSQQRAASPPASKSKAAVEELFESFFQESSPNPLTASHPYSQPEFVEETMDDEAIKYEVEDYLDTVPEANSESIIDTYSGSDNVEQAIVLGEEKAFDKNNSSDEDIDSSDFDLREGIIAQAILERPYK